MVAQKQKASHLNTISKIALVATAGALSLFIPFFIGLAIWASGVFIDGISTAHFLKEGDKEANPVMARLLKKMSLPEAILVFVVCIEIPSALLLGFLMKAPALGFTMIGVAHTIAGLENYRLL